jgi:arabinose-5-phosphate isomerase
VKKNGINNSFDVIEFGREVLHCEGQALVALSDALDSTFIEAVNVIFSITGKVVVSGIGKSGHVGSKIAASLASTGSPAFFVHPAEAVHGDLGMLGEGDVLILISNSGESPELMHLARYGKSLGLDIIAITADTTSSLAYVATVTLSILKIPEACPLGIAPSTSTTMVLALGDALALTVMKLRGFGKSDFARLHPGGKLGLRLSSVRDLMLAGDKLPLVERFADSHTTIMEMTSKRLGMTGVVDEQGNLLGVITDGDLRRSFEQGSDWAAETIMTGSPIIVTGELRADEALAVMHSRGITTLFVVEENSSRPVGLVHMHHLVGLGLL